MATRKTTGRKSTKAKYGRAAGKSVASAMRRRKKGTLRRGKSGRGGAVKSRRQAVAIGLSEAREKGAKVPRARKSTKGAKSTKSAKRGTKGGAKSAAKRGTKSTAKRSAAKRGAKSTAKRSTAKRAGSRRQSTQRQG
jgi:hypothetical protein